MFEILEYFYSDFYIMIGIWSIVLSSFVILIPMKMKTIEMKNKRFKLFLNAICIGLLGTDLISVLFMGKADKAAGYIVRVTVFLVFIFKYLYFFFFAYYIKKVAADRKAKGTIDILLNAMISFIGIVLVTVSQINPIVYHFDEQNYFYYNVGYKVVRISFLIESIIILIIILKNRKAYKRSTRNLFISFMLLIIVTFLLDYIVDMWYMQNITIFFSTQFIFLNDMFCLSEEFIRAQKKLGVAEYKAEHDLMTGLWNKKAGLYKIEEYLKKMTVQENAVLGFVDIDNFKFINDTYGHEIGDFWIEEIAGLLQLSCGEEDVACRYGGDEYIVFYGKVDDLQTIKTKMEEFRNHLSHKAAEKEQDVHCSIGLYHITEPGKSIKECIECADAALYKIKKDGKNSYYIQNCRNEASVD